MPTPRSARSRRNGLYAGGNWAWRWCRRRHSLHCVKGAGLLPHIRATVKLPMIVMKRTLQQLLGGAPFIISGACGMFRTDVLRKFGFSDRTKVEDLISPGHWWQTAIVFGRRIAASYTHRNATARVRNGVAGGVGLWATRSVYAPA